MIDKKAMRSISYGLYLVSSHVGDKVAGCTVNTFAQVTSEPLQVSVALNKGNHTTSVVQEAGTYTAVSLSENAAIDLIGKFGFFSSRDVDKFEPYRVGKDCEDHSYVSEQVVARFTVRVTDSIDLGTHILFIGEVIETEVLSSDAPMTYAYYHQVKGGKTPPTAPSYLGDGDDAPAASSTGEPAKHAWRCTVCGHIEYVDELPDDFVCPICGAGKDQFERIEVE